jgi:hypothetical protein
MAVNIKNNLRGTSEFYIAVFDDARFLLTGATSLLKMACAERNRDNSSALWVETVSRQAIGPGGGGAARCSGPAMRLEIKTAF